MIDCLDSSPGDYKIVLEKATLHVPVAELSMDIFSTYERKLQTTPAKLRFRRWTVASISVPSNTTNFESHSLFGMWSKH